MKLEEGRDRLPECPEHGLRLEVQTRDFCDVVDDFGHCGRYLVYPGEDGAPAKGEQR